jgi:hypothetical protein
MGWGHILGGNSSGQTVLKLRTKFNPYKYRQAFSAKIMYNSLKFEGTEKPREPVFTIF